MALMLGGTGVSRGIAIGRVRLLHEIQPRVVASHLRPGQVRKEITRLTTAIHEAITEIRGLQVRLRDKLPAEMMSFFDSHLMMLEDETLSQPVIELIRQNQYVSEWALALHRDNLVSMFEDIEDPYLRQRAEDVENVIAKVLRHLGGAAGTRPNKRKEYVVVTRNLAPADVMEHQQDGMRALICSHGGNMSHAAIVARSLGIPAITGVPPALDVLHEGDDVIVDGGTGMIVARPDTRSVRYYRQVQREEKRRLSRLRALRDKPARTLDGIDVELLANVDSPADATRARQVGAGGIGLFRSDGLFVHRADLPDEREQLAIYRRVIRSMRGRPVCMRTLDVWPDGLDRGQLHSPRDSAESVLGLRGIRLSLAHPEVFETQLRAMFRASTLGPTRILLPMVSNVAELVAASSMIEQVKKDLIAKKRKIGSDIQIGALIEIPAAALACRLLVRHVDYLAIGTNDLTQYTLGVARENEEVQYLFNSLHPAVLRLVSDVIAVGKKTGKPVILCGELASDPRVCRLLLGLGLRHLSVHPSSLLEVKDAILNTDVSRIAKLSRRALSSDGPARTELLLDRLNDSD